MRIFRFLIFISLVIPSKSNGQTWSAVGTGVSNNAYAFAVDTLNNELYVGGWFLNAGGISAPHIAKWNGTTWSSVGTGMNNNSNTAVRSLCIFNGELYAGGNFDSAGGIPASNIAKWDGSNWSALGSGLNGTVYAIKVYNGELYAGGFFLASGTTAINNIAKWDGSNWLDVGGGIDYWVLTLCTFNNDLYAGGYFTHAGGMSARRVAKWDGSNWDSVGLGFCSVVRKLYVHNNELYAGGDFTPCPLNSARLLSKLSGNNWLTMPSPSGGNYPGIRDLASYQGELYVTGDFTSPTYIAKFDGSSCAALGTGLSWVGYCLGEYNNELYVGGSFAWAGSNVANTTGLAKWNDVVGISENNTIDSTIISPNPFSEQVIFILPQLLETKFPCKLIIYDEIGKSAKEINNIVEFNYTFTRGDLAPGIYFYEFRDSKNSFVSRGKMIAN